ncbi:MAG: hypothetical protein GXZ14_00970 [Ruminococcaceae bacterium]|nr:hypothetical protein [Oscillospiraceae bacterium]
MGEVDLQKLWGNECTIQAETMALDAMGADIYFSSLTLGEKISAYNRALYRLYAESKGDETIDKPICWAKFKRRVSEFAVECLRDDVKDGGA